MKQRDCDGHKGKAGIGLGAHLECLESVKKDVEGPDTGSLKGVDDDMSENE